MHPSAFGVNSSVFIEKSQFQYLETQSSYGMPNGFSSFENNSTAPYTLWSAKIATKIEKSKNVHKIQVDAPSFLTIQKMLLLFTDLLNNHVIIIIFDNLN